tara:strand:+ start:23433 stop:24971 length:1539 start_codon:yes stop_codon:yes gene_type:complete
LFHNVSLTVNKHEKIALIGNNGSGKSTLLKIISKELGPSGGQATILCKPYYIPQIFGQYDYLTIAQALGIDNKLDALKEILKGNVTEVNLGILDDDWTIADRCQEALAHWQLDGKDLSQKMGTLSGGEKTKVFLAGIIIYRPELILLDEPSNHLDTDGRRQLYDYVRATSSSLVVVGHDKNLLNILNRTCELDQRGLTIYGGNYDFYAEQKRIGYNALSHDIQNKEKALRKTKEKERETLERQQKLDARGKKKQEKAGVSRIMMNTLRNSAENSTSKIKSAHSEKIVDLSNELKELRSSKPEWDKMKLGLDSSSLHNGKILFSASKINFSYHTRPLWKNNLTLDIASGDRLSLKGPNGSGKTTLIKLILGKLVPNTGTVHRVDIKWVYIDQDYSLIDNGKSVYDQAESFNASAMQEHEIKLRLNRFLFTANDWDKSCGTLSGGERMRLTLCCLTIGNRSPDMIVLDEPTNNLDIQNIGILTEAIKEYHGTLVVISHDEHFLEQINIERWIDL